MRAKPQAFVEEKFVRRLNKDASAVACIGLAAAGAAVFHILQNGKRVGYRFVVFVAFDVGDEADATGISFKFWAV